MRVVWTPEARADLAAVLSYIAERNPTAAASVAARIHRAVGNIALFPRSARSDTETGTREYVVHGLPLLIIYEIGDDLAEIVAVFHTSRDPRAKTGY